MGLDAPLWLLALAAGALPVLAHRIRRKDLLQIALPTFAMLEQARALQRNRRNLNDVVLLATRIAMMMLLALALAVPYSRTWVAFGDGDVSTTVLVLDDSMSMRRELDGESLLARALDRARSVVRSLPDGSEVAVVLAGSPPRRLIELTSDLPTAHQALARVRQSDRGTDLTGGLALGLQTLEGGTMGKRRLLLLSDLARHTRLERRLIRRADAEIHIERVGREATANNLAITAASAVPNATAPGRTSLSVEVSTFGDNPSQVSLQVGQPGHTQQESATLRFSDGLARVTVDTETPGPEQDPVIELRLDHKDALAVDDTFQVLAANAGGLRVLLINGDPHPGSRRDELYYLAQAMALVPEKVAHLHLRAIDAASLVHEDLSQSDVVVLANVPAPPPKTAGQLLDFVSTGGGLVLASGDRVQPQDYNSRLKALLPGHISAVSRAQELAFSATDRTPAWANTDHGLSQVTTRTRLLVDAFAPPLLRFSDGTPALLERTIGRGRVLLVATTLDDGWTDLPIRPGFMPLVVGMARQAAGDRARFAGRYAPGATVEIPIPAGAQAVEVVAPDGTRTRYDDLTRPVLSYGSTLDSGVYRVLAGAERGPLHFVRERSFVVERPASESDTRSGADADQVLAGASGSDRAAVKRVLSPWCWLIAGFLALLETILRIRPATREGRMVLSLRRARR